MTGRVAAVILAAGGSTRMGSAKPLLRFEGRSLVARAVELARSAGLGPVAVVVGARADDVRAELASLPVPIGSGPVVVDNPDWALGMGTSIRAGVAAIGPDPAVEAAILLLADQPMVARADLAALVDRFRLGRSPIVASEYGGSAGVPALFARSMFGALGSLPDAEGAKRLILEAGASADRVAAPGALVDVDTPDDYDRLRLLERDRPRPGGR